MTGPFEPEHGQEDDPADVLLALLVGIRLLRDLAEHLDHLEPEPERADLLLRIGAVLAVLHRVRTRLEGEHDHGGQ